MSSKSGHTSSVLGANGSSESQAHLKKVAIIGSGVAGIGALWALNRTHHDVYMYEADSRLGGHTNTVEWVHGKNKTLVDTGFIVMNTATYPNFIAFLKAIKIPTVPTEMTFGVSRDHGLFEWSGTSLAGVFAQMKNIFSPRMWRMIFDIIRFNQFALDLLIDEDRSKVYLNGEQDSSVHTNGDSVKHKFSDPELSIGDYLAREGYSNAFRDDYLIPMTAAVWSTSPDKCSLDFPAVTLVRFMWNHHLLTTVGVRPQWLTIPNGSRAYIDAVMRGFPSNHLFLNTAVMSITNTTDGQILLHFANGKTSDPFDHVVLATHGDQALKIISPSATPTEKAILQNFRTSENTAILHSDLSLMPKRKDAWAAWNYITLSSSRSSTVSNDHKAKISALSRTGGNIDQVCLTYNMNILQHLPPSTFGDVLVTLNPLHLPPSSAIQGSYSYSHPLYTSASVRAQQLLPKIQNKRGISYAGAWTGYGFHEDAFSSGIRAAMEHLGAELPFAFTDSTFSRGKEPVLGIQDRLLRLWILFVQMVVVLIERLLGVERELGLPVVKVAEGKKKAI